MIAPLAFLLPINNQIFRALIGAISPISPCLRQGTSAQVRLTIHTRRPPPEPSISIENGAFSWESRFSCPWKFTREPIQQVGRWGEVGCDRHRRQWMSPPTFANNANQPKNERSIVVLTVGGVSGVVRHCVGVRSLRHGVRISWHRWCWGRKQWGAHASVGNKIRRGGVFEFPPMVVHPNPEIRIIFE